MSLRGFHSVFFFRSCTVLFVCRVICLPTLLHWYIFFSSLNFSFFKFWPLLNRSRASRRRFHCLHRRKRTSRLASLSVRTPAHAACSTQQDDLRCQECASVHKHNLPLLFLFISVSPTVLPDLFFSFLAFGGFLPNKPKGETRVTILQVYDCSF